MAETSNPENDGTLAAYIEKTDQLNDLVLKFLQKMNGDSEVSHEEGGGKHPNNHGRRGSSPLPRVEMRNESHDEFVTREELIGLLKGKQLEGMPDGIAFQPPYPREIQAKPYPKGYRPPAFRMYNGRNGSDREHVIQFIDDLGIFSHDLELRLREFSKSLEGRAYSWYANLQPGSVQLWEELVSQFCGKFFTMDSRIDASDLFSLQQEYNERLEDYVQRFCEKTPECRDTISEKNMIRAFINGMMDKYRIYIKNHDIRDFAKLIYKARNTGALVSRLRRTTRIDSSNGRGWKPPSKRTYEVAFAQGAKGKGTPRRDPPEFPCKVEKVIAPIEAWIQDGSLELPEVRKMPMLEDKRHPKYCHFHRVTTHPTKSCYTLRKNFDRRLQKGEVILEDDTMEERPFPHHPEEVMMITNEPGGSDVQIKEIEEEMIPKESTRQLVQALLKTKLFDSFFNQLDFQEEARDEATKGLLVIAQRYGPTCYMISHPFKKIAKGKEDMIIVSAKDHQYDFAHNKPLYVKARVSELGVKRALVDNSASVNLMPKSVFTALHHGQERLTLHEVTLSGFASNKSKTIRHIVVDLRVGPLRGPTRFHVLEEDTSYHLLLGRPWIYAHNCVPSTLHLCLKASQKGKTIHISATRDHFTFEEAHLAEAILFDETAYGEASLTLQPRGIAIDKNKEESRESEKYQVKRVLLPGGRKAYRL